MDTVKSFSGVLEKLISLQYEITDIKNEYNSTLGLIESEIVNKKRVVSELEMKLETIRRETQSRTEELDSLEKHLTTKEKDLAYWEAELVKREDAHNKEVADERKVSFVKATQAQLKDKLDEIEIIQKQLAYYKKQSELVGLISLKYGLNGELLSIENIERAILKGWGPQVETTSKKGKNTKDIKKLEEQQRLEAELKAKEEKQRLEAELKAKEEQQRLEAELKAKEEQQRLEAELKAKEEQQRLEAEEQISQEAEEEVEVEDFTYKGVMYYLDRGTGEIFSRLESDEVGDVIGVLDAKGRVKFNRKK